MHPISHVKNLDFERIAGTDGEKKGYKYIVDFLNKNKIENTVEDFDLISFDFGTAEISVDKKTFNLKPYGLNENFQISAELVFLENLEALLLNRGAFKGKIILTYGFSRKYSKILKESEIAGLIIISGPYKQATSLSHRQKNYKDGYVPSAVISYDDAAKLSKYDGKEIQFTIKQNVYESTAHNVIATIPGNSNETGIIYLVGHYDTVANTSGSSDNTGGTSILLSVAEKIKDMSLKRTIKIIFFSGEELGLLGSSNYVKTHLNEIKKNAAIVINVDVSGDDIGKDAFGIIGTNEIKGYVAGITREKGLSFDSKLQIYSSDGMPFAEYEIPSINIARFGGKSSFNIHTHLDCVKFVSKRGLENTFKATLNIVEKLGKAEIFPLERKIDAKLRPDIEKYLWNLRFEKPTLKWEEKYKK